MNIDAPWPDLYEAEQRVLKIQAKLHQWAGDDPHRRFDDLFNLVSDPAFLTVAWDRVRRNRGARSVGVDGVAPRSVVFGTGTILIGLRDDLKAQRFVPSPVREKLIPKKGGKLRGLGIPTARDRTVQAALKLVLEPIFEADFKPCSYGFRPKRRAQDAIEEIFFYTTHHYEWVLEGDIKSCFDEIDHTALMGRVRDRIGDKRVLGLVKAFLKAGVLGEDKVMRDTVTGTPQGGILSPLLANIALSVLDEHFMGQWESWGGTYGRNRRRARGLANYRLVRYADDFVVMVIGTRDHAEALRPEVAAVLAPMGLSLSEEKTVITSIDEGFDFLGFHIQRKLQEGTKRRTLYTYPSKTALAAIKAKVRVLTQGNTNQTLANLLQRLNPVLRGWANYFRHGVSSRTFDYLNVFSWRRVVNWLRHKYRRANWRWLRRHYLPGWRPTDGRRGQLVQPGHDADHSVSLPGDTYSLAVDEERGGHRQPDGMSSWGAGCVGTRTSGSEGGPGRRTSRKADTAPRSDPNYWLSDLLEELGANMHLAHPLGNNWGNRRVKNDARDAEDLADLLRMGRLAEAYIAPPELREKREAVRYRARLMNDRSSLKNQVHAVLAKEGVSVAMSDVFGVAGSAMLDTLALGPAYRSHVDSLRRLIAAIDKEIARLDREIAKSLKDDRGYNAIQEIQGIGPVFAAIFVTEIGDVTRFTSARHLCSWAGLTPRHRESDTTVRRGHITKQGSTLVRWAAVEASIRQHKQENPIAAHRIQVAERRGKRIGNVAAARKLLILVYYGLRDGEIRCLARER